MKYPYGIDGVDVGAAVCVVSARPVPLDNERATKSFFRRWPDGDEQMVVETGDGSTAGVIDKDATGFAWQPVDGDAQLLDADGLAAAVVAAIADGGRLLWTGRDAAAEGLMIGTAYPFKIVRVKVAFESYSATLTTVDDAASAAVHGQLPDGWTATEGPDGIVVSSGPPA